MILGVDPGLSGAIAALDDSNGRLCQVEDLPLMSNGKSSTVKQQLNPAHLADLISAWRDVHGSNSVAYVELVRSAPQQGVASMFSLGDTFGVIRAVLAVLEIPVTLIAPSTWKRSYHLLNCDKEQSRAKAIALYPTAPLHLKKHHGRAEALLIARWGWWQHQPTGVNDAKAYPVIGE